MAISSGFYNSVNGDRTYDADQFGSLFDGIIAPGVFPNVGDKFRVRPTNNGMSVYVGAGKAWLDCCRPLARVLTAAHPGRPSGSARAAAPLG